MVLAWVFGNKDQKRRPQARARPAYEDAKKIAAKGSVAARRELASHEDLEPEFLYYLATDEAPEVRRQVAENTGTPLQADVILASDHDEEVRVELARKIGRLVPNLSPEQNKRLATFVLEIVDILAADSLPRVRATLAEEIKLATTVPPSVVQKMARDIEEIVSAPILEYSPLLSDQDLLAIVKEGLTGGGLMALARRRALSEPIADAVAKTRHVEAVATLLENNSARIGDTTLDMIAVEAEGHREWHVPMVGRDSLPIRVIRRVATFVSAALVEKLIERNPLPPAVVNEVRMAVRKRIESGKLVATENEAEPETAEARAKRLFEAGALNEQTIATAVEEGDRAFVRHGLVHLSGLPSPTVQKLLSTGGAKGITVLAWKSRLSMAMAESLQRNLGRVKPQFLVRATRDGQYPMSEADIEWYLGFYT